MDEPTVCADFDWMRWVLAHDEVRIYQEEDGDWMVQVNLACAFLNTKGKCSAYDFRSYICQEFSPDECERVMERREEFHHQHSLQTPDDVDALAKETLGIVWDKYVEYRYSVNTGKSNVPVKRPRCKKTLTDLFGVPQNTN